MSLIQNLQFKLYFLLYSCVQHKCLKYILVLKSTSAEKANITAPMKISAEPNSTIMLTKQTASTEATLTPNQTDQASSLPATQTGITLMSLATMTPMPDSSNSTTVITTTDKMMIATSTTSPDITGKKF